MNVRVLHGRRVSAGGVVYNAGQTLTVPSDRAVRLLASGHVERVTAKKPTKARAPKK